MTRDQGPASENSLVRKIPGVSSDFCVKLSSQPTLDFGAKSIMKILHIFGDAELRERDWVDVIDPFLLEHDRVFISMPKSSVWKLPWFIALTQPNVAFFASSNLHSDCINVDSQESCIKANFWLPDCINVISQHDRIKKYVCMYCIYIYRDSGGLKRGLAPCPPPYRCLKATWVFHHTGWPRPASEGVDLVVK